MAPKRHRGEGSSSGAARSYDHTKFVSEAASERFHAYLISNNLILERGLVLFQYNGRVIRNMIAERGWETLTTQPEAVRVVIVKEFNANAARLEIKWQLFEGSRCHLIVSPSTPITTLLP